jgi:outer membrane protein
MNQKIQQFSGILSLIALIGVIILFIFQWTKPDKVAYVKTDELLAKYQGMVEAKAKYEEKAMTWQSNIDTLKAEFTSLVEDYKENGKTLSNAKKQEVEKGLQAKQKQLNDYQQSISQQAQEEDQKLTQGVLNQVNSFIEEYGKENGYKIIFGANGSGTIVYGTDAINITNKVLMTLNKEYNGGA